MKSASKRIAKPKAPKTPFPAPPQAPKRKHKLLEREGRWICVFADTAEEVPYGEQTSEEQLAVYRRNLDSLLPAAEPRTAKTRPSQQPATTFPPPPQPIEQIEPEFEMIEILLTPARPAKFSPPSISRERYWDAITDRLKILVVEEIKDGYGRDYARTDQLRRELNDIQSQASHAFPDWNVFNDARCHKIKLQQDALLWPRVIADIVGVPGYDQRRLRYDIETRIRQHELAYVKLEGHVVALLQRALTAIATAKEILPKHYNLRPPSPLTPDVPATLLEQAKSAVTRTIKVKKEAKLPSTSIGQRARAIQIINGSPTTFTELSDLTRYYTLRELGLSESQEEHLRRLLHEYSERRKSPNEVPDTKIKSMMADTRLSNGKIVYLDPWMLHELTDLAVQAKRLIESCPRHKPDDQGRCEDPSCFWRNRHNILNWTQSHANNDSAVQAGNDLYDSALRHSRDFKPVQKESSKVDLLMERMGETLDRIPEWLGRRGVRKTR